MTLKLECGHIVTLEAGNVNYDYYDCRWVSIVRGSEDRDGWYNVIGLTKIFPNTGTVGEDNYGFGSLNAQRMMCAYCATNVGNTKRARFDDPRNRFPLEEV